MSENPHEVVGRLVGNYRLISWLGRGGYADVYLGEHISLKTQGAIKMLHVQLSEKALQDFFNEARTIARLKHINIIRMLDYGVENGDPFLVLTYAPSGSLRQCFPSGNCVPPEQVVPIVKQVASALDYAHRRRLVHRDVKPANMLLGPRDEVLLSDFGLAVMAQSTSPQIPKGVEGTVYYMAPEQWQGKAHFASDQYALGVVAYEWLCGQRPFNGSMTEIASQHMIIPPPSLREKVPRLPAGVERVVFKALAKKPNQRYENVTAFAMALEDACQNSKLTATHIFAVPQLSPLVKPPQLPAQPSALPVPIKPAPRRSQHLEGIWRTALVFVTMVMLLAGSMGLWYGITHFHTLMQYIAPGKGRESLTQMVKGNIPTVVNTASTATAIASGGAPSTSAIPKPDCLKGSPSNLVFFVQSYAFPFPTKTITLTNCGGTTTTWSYSEQTDHGTWLDVAAASQSIAPGESEQVHVSLTAGPNLHSGTYREAITFVKGSAAWTISVSYTIQ